MTDENSEINYGEYFKEEEFYCHCGQCDFPGMSQLLLDKLNMARASAGCAFKINSGYRCHSMNRAVGGATTSAHTTGMAVDIHCIDSVKRFRIVEACLPYFNRIGIAKDFIHVDVDHTKPGAVIWVY